MVYYENTTAIEALTSLTKQDFLFSFMVDARGRSIKGCHYSGGEVSFAVLFIINTKTFFSYYIYCAHSAVVCKMYKLQFFYHLLLFSSKLKLYVVISLG